MQEKRATGMARNPLFRVYGTHWGSALSFRAVFFVLLFGCIGGFAHADDLSSIRAIRSLAAEASEVVRLESQNRLTQAYANAMKEQAGEQLANEAQNATAPQVKSLAGQAIVALNRNDANALAKIAQRLFTMEGPHEPAD
jgi:hypothetical protein